MWTTFKVFSELVTILLFFFNVLIFHLRHYKLGEFIFYHSFPFNSLASKALDSQHVITSLSKKFS